MTTTKTADRIEELRAMPYEEYLRTPEWKATRKRILERDNYQCQGCRITGVLFNVHHYTYERLGCEEDEDLVTLCEDCHEQLHRLIAEPPKLPFLHKCGVGLCSAALGSIGIEGFLHAPLPAEIAVLVGAFLLAKKSPAIYAHLKQTLPEEVLGWLGQGPAERKEGEWSLVDRWMGKHRRTPALPKEAEEESEDDDTISFDDYNNVEDDDMSLLSFGKQEGMTVFSTLLKTGWRPTMNRVYVGTDTWGRHLFVPVKKLCHIALSGATGHGKSSLIRLIMVQLCYLKLPVTLLNPHYMVFDADHSEDWTPYTPYLQKDPMDCKNINYIERVLYWMAYDLLEKRKERCSHGGSAGKPFFFILDEYPDIKAEIKRAPEYVGRILRQGRKYGIFLMIASQDFSVKTLGVEGEGAIRKCFLTTFYVGGDPVTAKELLNKPLKDIPENSLGEGVIMLKCATLQDPTMIHVPYLDNESLYLLLGPSTHVAPNEQDTGTLDLTTEENSTPTAPDTETLSVVPPIRLAEKRDTRRKAEDIDLNVAIAVWNGGFSSRAKLAKAFDIAENQASKLMDAMGVTDRRMDG